MRGLDYAGGRPSAASIKDAGYDFVVRYLTDGGPALPGKLLLPSELTDLLAHNIAVCFMWETTADRALSGFDAGFTDARLADAYLQSLGLGPQIIYFAVDFDSTEIEQDVINAYLRGAGNYLGSWRVGIYGGYWPVKRALDAGVATWAEQTVAWSGGNIDPRAVILQTAQQCLIDGIVCDILTTHVLDYGQYPPPFGSRKGDEVDFNTPWVDHYHDNLPDRGLQQPIGDLISWAATHSAHAVEAVNQLRADLPNIIRESLKDAVIHITIDNKVQ